MALSSSDYSDFDSLPSSLSQDLLVFSVNVEDTRSLAAGRGTCVCTSMLKKPQL